MKPRSRLSSVSSRGELLGIQRNFAEIIRRPLNEDDSMIGDRRAGEMILPNDRLSADERLELYANQYWWRIEGAFDEDFLLLRRVLGEKRYEEVRDKYLLKYPSVSFTLRNLGSRLPEFLLRSSKLLGQKKDLAVDCACFEWALIESFDAGEFLPIGPKELGRRDFVKLKIFLQPHVQVLSLRYPVHEIERRKGSQDQDGASNTLTKGRKRRGDGALSVKRKGARIAVYRHRFSVHSKPLSQAQYTVLERFRKGTSLMELFQGSKRVRGVDGSEIQRWFSQWSALGWLYVKQR